MGATKGKKGTYTFAKLKRRENYKEWAQEMEFALQNAGLGTYAGIPIPKMTIAVEPPELSNLEPSQTHDLENLDLLDFGATDHAHISRDAFISFCPMIEKAFSTYGRAVYFLWSRNISKKFACSNVTFTNVLYVLTLVNNL